MRYVVIAIPLLLLFGLSLASGILMIVGGLKMLRLQSYNWAMAACILAVLPFNPVGIIGLVIGIWGLVVLNQPNIRAAFRGGVSLPDRGRTGEKPTWLWLVVAAAICLALVCLIPPGAIFLWKAAGSSADARVAGPDPFTDEARIEGYWKYVTYIQNEKAADPLELRSWKIHFSDGVCTDSRGDFSERYTYELNAHGTPKRIERVFTEGPSKGLNFGIYKLEGDRLTICWGLRNGWEPPTEFKSGMWRTLVVLKRDTFEESESEHRKE
jgi:uncharacterized protein (TIGR03067 family)